MAYTFLYPNGRGGYDNWFVDDNGQMSILNSMPATAMNVTPPLAPSALPPSGEAAWWQPQETVQPEAGTSYDVARTQPANVPQYPQVSAGFSYPKSPPQQPQVPQYPYPSYPYEQAMARQPGPQAMPTQPPAGQMAAGPYAAGVLTPPVMGSGNAALNALAAAIGHFIGLKTRGDQQQQQPQADSGGQQGPFGRAMGTLLNVVRPRTWQPQPVSSINNAAALPQSSETDSSK